MGTSSGEYECASTSDWITRTRTSIHGLLPLLSLLLRVDR